MKLSELLQEAGIDLPERKDTWDIEITGIASDSGRVKEGYLFVALRGLHCDGAQYIGEAFSRGAVFGICERPSSGERILNVENARLALARLWDAWYGHPGKELSLIGVTGTNGKTSCATMLCHILEQADFRCGLIGTVECRCGEVDLRANSGTTLANMTTPDPEELYAVLARMRELGARFVVMEVTSHALALDKVAPLFFKLAIFTNLTPDHLDLHGDMEGYFLEKKKLFAMCEAAILSYSTTYGVRLSQALEIPFLELSPKTVREIAINGESGVSFSLCVEKGKTLRLHVPVPGGFTVENAGLAALGAYSLGVSGIVIEAALASFTGVRGRMERICADDGDISVFLDYAHTPDALEKLLLSARSFAAPHQRVVVLFGCGGERDREKRREMGRIASRLADLVIVTSDNARGEDPDSILEQILRGVDKEKAYTVIKDRGLAIAYAIENAHTGDVLLLAGKGHEEYEIRGRERLPFSERRIVAECLARRKERRKNAD